jgi:recombination protein RecT
MATPSITQKAKEAADAARARSESTAVEQQQAPKQIAILQALEDPKQIAELAKALPPGLDVDRFQRMALTLVKSDPKMLELGATIEGMRSMMQAFHRCAQLGLEVNPDTGHVYLLPFRVKSKLTLQFILGYKGILALARRSGALKNIQVHAVYENDEFEISYGIDGVCRYKPLLKGDRGDILCYFGYANFTDGGYYYTHVTLDEIRSHRERSASAGGPHSPWDSDPVAMSKKTVVRIMAPYLPLTQEAGAAISTDDNEVLSDGSMRVIDIDTVDPEPPPPAEDVIDGGVIEPHAEPEPPETEPAPEPGEVIIEPGCTCGTAIGSPASAHADDCALNDAG